MVMRCIPSSVSLEIGRVSGKRSVCHDGTRGDISASHEGTCGWGQNSVCGIGEMTSARTSGKVKSNLVTSPDTC